MPLASSTVIELDEAAVTFPTKSSIRSNELVGAPTRGRVAAVATLAVLKFNANVPLVTVKAVFRSRLMETPEAWPLVSVSGKGVVMTCADPAVKTMLQMVPLRHVLFRVAPV